MPYTINRTSGAKITTIQDGTINTTALDITLVGKNYTGYGEVVNENLVKLLENFSNAAKPAKPLTGQLWYDSVNRTIKLYTGLGVGDAQWKSVGIVERGISKPIGNNNAGDLWYNTNENRLYAYSGSGSVWTLVGPLTTRGSANGALDIELQVKDTTVKNLVLRIVSNDGNVGIFSKETFDVNTSEADYQPYFNVVKQGLTLPNADSNGRSITVDNEGNVSGYQLWGSAATARALVRKNNVLVSADDLLKTTELAALTNNINVGNDQGILIGVQGTLKLHVMNGQAHISHVGNNSVDSLHFNLTTANLTSNNPGSYYNVFYITTGTNNSSKILPNSTATVYLGTASQRFSFAYVGTITSSLITSTTINGTTISGTNVNDSGNRVITSVGVTAGTGLSGGGTVTGPSGSVTLNNTGVLSLTGTANRISVSAATGNVTLNLPQDLHTGATVTFNTINGSSINGSSINGTAVYDNSSRVITAATISSNAVTSIAGTANQVSVSGNVGTVTLSLPQSIATNSSVQFGDMLINKLLVGSATGGSAGQIRASGDIYAFATSDRQFKENIRDIPDPVTKAITIGGKLFDWTDNYLEKRGGVDGLYVRKEDVGVIAQDVQSVLPEAVRTREDGTLAVDYPKLCALAFAAIADLQKQIDELKNK